MPTYVYRFVETGETIEVQQAFTDDTLTEHPHPDSGDLLAVKKVFQPVGVTFKGSGFFKTDNRGSSASTPPGSSTDTSSASDSSSTSNSTSPSTNGAESSTTKDSSSSNGSSSTSSSTSSAAASSTSSD